MSGMLRRLQLEGAVVAGAQDGTALATRLLG
jgi:hypothetical protein